MPDIMSDASHVLTAGVDEAGRGPLAGPVVCAAVILDPAQPIEGLKDSKVLSAIEREALAVQIKARALAFAIVEVSVAEIDRLNILQATLHGMSLALAQLNPAPLFALIDGNRLPKTLCCPARAIVKGDATESAISAASILAKTHRDALMIALDQRFPQYEFATHKGYPTPAHLALLKRYGACHEHRASFAPVRAVLQSGLSD
jgi:ribonuclease HII